MGSKTIEKGSGWRLGWDPDATEYQGLVGTDDWAIELTESELIDFCRLLTSLANSMSEMAKELMDEEKIACEAESDRLWMEVEGYPHAYSLHLILNQGRRCEGMWSPTAVPELVQAARVLQF